MDEFLCFFLKFYFVPLEMQKAKTEECKQLLEQEFEKFWNPLMMEVTYPFERTAFFSECPTASKQHFVSDDLLVSLFSVTVLLW